MFQRVFNIYRNNPDQVTAKWALYYICIGRSNDIIDILEVDQSAWFRLGAILSTGLELGSYYE